MRAEKLKPKGHRIGFYIRVSTEEQAENPEGSIRNQEERLRMAVKLKNMEGHFGDIKAVFVDRAKSGKDTNRPELQKLLLAIRKRELDLVMVSELSRISRSIKDFSEIWDLMQSNGCGFSSLRENFDTTTAAGEMVLFTVANIAQFERRQISERVSANFNARAQRGLFNGGPIPAGYKRIPERRGYLAIDEETAPAIQAAFKAFLREGTLQPAAHWLNQQGYRLKQKREGGGDRSRLGFFTSGNLKKILRNRTYSGIKVFEDRGKWVETDAVWPAIIERETFDKVEQLLDNNFRRNKNAMIGRYPYQLVGLVTCKICGDRMVGKSAHGKSEKIGYYEHGASTKKATFMKHLKRECLPYRVLAKHLEPAVWQECKKLLLMDSISEKLIQGASRDHQLNPNSREIEKCNQTVFSSEQQLERLAERLASLPDTVSPTPIYKQMEKLEAHKKQATQRLGEIQSNGTSKDVPATASDFRNFLNSIAKFASDSEDTKMQAQVIRALVSKIIVVPEGFEIHYKVGQAYVSRVLAHLQTAGLQGVKNAKRAASTASSPDALQNLDVVCSTTGQNGVTDGV